MPDPRTKKESVVVMNSTFVRAFVGFIVLTAGLAGMALVALKSLERYADSPWWAMLLVVVLTLVAEVSIYTTTLHEPIHDWIREPKLRQAREMDNDAWRQRGYKEGYDERERIAKKDADRNSGQNPS